MRLQEKVWKGFQNGWFLFGRWSGSRSGQKEEGVGLRREKLPWLCVV